MPSRRSLAIPTGPAGWRRAAAGLFGMMVGVLACASPAPPWFLAQAERELAEGNPRHALQYSERAIHMSHAQPSERAAALHVRALRALGRDVEADAFEEFAQRYASGIATDVRETTPSWRECIRPWVEEDRPNHRWHWRGVYDIGTIAASFQIRKDGSVDAIRVMRAKHPAAAWLLIEAVGAARLHDVRLRELREDPDVAFPLTLCVWLDDRSV